MKSISIFNLKHPISLMLILLLSTLSPTVSYAATNATNQDIKGTIYVSSITENRLNLTGDAIIIVDKDFYLREIYGPNYSVTIKVSFGCKLTVDQDKNSTAAIDVKNLTLQGEGSTLITGKHFGVCLRNKGTLTIQNTTATINARYNGSNSDASSTQSVIGETGTSILINNSAVEFYSASGNTVSGYIFHDSSFNHQMESVKVMGAKSKVYFYGPVGYEYDINNFEVAAGEVYLNENHWECVCAKNVKLTGGKTFVNETGGLKWNAIVCRNMEVSNCELNIEANTHGVECDGITINNATVNAKVSGKSYAIYANLNGIEITGEKTNLQAEGPWAGLYSEGDITIKCNRLWAKASSKGYYGIYTARKLNIDILSSTSVYEALGVNTNPIYANDGVFMEGPAEIECTPYTGSGAGTQVTVSYDSSNHRLTTTGGAYDYISFLAPLLPEIKQEIVEVNTDETIWFDSSAIKDYVPENAKNLIGRLYKRYATSAGNPEKIVEYHNGTLKSEYAVNLTDDDNYYLFWLELTAEPYRNTIKSKTAYLAIKTYKKGDVNQDWKIDINDVVAVINTMAGNKSYINTSDVNGDKKIDINDVVTIINIMAGK